MDRNKTSKVFGPKARGSSSGDGPQGQSTSVSGRSNSETSSVSSVGTTKRSRGGELQPSDDERRSLDGRSRRFEEPGDMQRQRSAGDARQKGGKEETRKSKEKPVSAEGTVFASLPKLKDVQPGEQAELTVRKLKECSVVFDFTADTHQADKEGKRQTLLELIEHANTMKGSLDESVLRSAVDMVAANIFRTLAKRERTALDLLEPEDDVQWLDAAWPHLEFVYEFFHRLLGYKELDTALVAQVVNKSFVLRLLDLFESEDSRERDCLKMTVNRIWNRFSSLRSTVRRGIKNALLKAIYEADVQIGVAELLEVQAKIISSFSTPLKDEAKDLFHRVVAPLHKVCSVPQFHTQLVECTKRFMEKDPTLTFDAVTALLRFWPNSMGSKQILFLKELEEVLVMMPVAQFRRVQDMLARRLAACISCPNSDVAEKALGLWKNDKIVKLIAQNCKGQFPIIISALYKNSTQHWHNSVHSRTIDVLKLLMETDPELFDASSAKHRKEAEEEEKRETERERRWAMLQKMHDKRAQGAARSTQAAALPRGEAAPRPQGRPSVSSRALAQQLQAFDMLLNRERYGVGISWDPGGKADLTFQAIAVAQGGKIAGAVHENNRTCLQSSLHYTDTKMLGCPQCGKMVWIVLSRLPESVGLVIFVVAAPAGGHLGDAANMAVHVVEDSCGQEVTRFDISPTSSDIGAVALIRRIAPNTWKLSRVAEFVRDRRHFMDILEPTLGKLIREVMPEVPKRQQANIAYNMEIGGAADLPQPTVAKWLFIGLGWDLAPAASDGVSLEVAAVLFDARGSHLAAVSADNAEVRGARHSGSGFLGGGVVLDLGSIGAEVSQIFLIGNVSTSGSTFEQIQRPHCCVIDPNGHELLRFVVTEDQPETGLIISRLIRDSMRGRWFFQALGNYCSGVTWSDSLEDMKKLWVKEPTELQSAIQDMDGLFPPKRIVVAL